jgi:uncharacterized protein
MNFKKTALFMMLCMAAGALFAGDVKLYSVKAYIVNGESKKIYIDVELAMTESDKIYGLMNRTSVDENWGMLFVYKREEYVSFWMKNVPFPLDIAYIDRFGIIKEIQHMKPLNEKITYPSKYPVMYALEVNKDWFAQNNIKPGCKLFADGFTPK